MTRALRIVSVLLMFGVMGLTVAPAQDKTDKKDPKKIEKKAEKKDDTKTEKKAPTEPTFELYEDTAKQFRFRLVDTTGANLTMASKGYKTKAEAEKVIARIKSVASKATVDDQSK